MHRLVMLLVRSSEFPQELEVQGKSDVLENLRVSSEKMRSGSQTKVLKLIPKVVRNVLKLCKCNGVDACVVEELHASVLLLVSTNEWSSQYIGPYWMTCIHYW